MKVQVSLCAALCGLLLLANSCIPNRIYGDGNLVTKEIAVDDFDEIEAGNSPMRITYVQSEGEPGLTVTVDQNIFDMYEIKVQGDKLRIRPKGEYKHPQRFSITESTYQFSPTEFTVTIHSKSLRRLGAAGNIDFSVNSTLKTEELVLKLAGSCKVHLTDTVWMERLDVDIAGNGTLNAAALFGNELNGEIAGSGRLNLGGNIATASFDIAGSGTVRAFDLEVEDMRCKIAGSGDIEICAKNSIHTNIAGSGRIKYTGNPQEIVKKVAGAGSIVKVD